MRVRLARDSDVERASALVRRSITALCSADYRDNPRLLGRWLANKNPEDMRRWISRTTAAVYVAVEDDERLAAVGMVDWRGDILLNYVAPEARFRGASKSMVLHMEDQLRTRGVRKVALVSTHVALRLYESLGYEAIGRVASRFGALDGIELTKMLAPGRTFPGAGDCSVGLR